MFGSGFPKKKRRGGGIGNGSHTPQALGPVKNKGYRTWDRGKGEGGLGTSPVGYKNLLAWFSGKWWGGGWFGLPWGKK